MKFLNSNFFYSKEISVYQKKLIQLFGKKFNIEDIEKTRLIPRNLTLNFDYLVEAVHGVPTADFSLKKLIWNNRPISEKVVVCAAFYVYGLRLIWRYSVRRLNDELIYSGVKKPVKLPNKSTLNNKKAEQIKKHKNKH